MFVRPLHSLSLLLSISLLLIGATPALSEVLLDPGEVASDVAADDSSSRCEAPSCEVSFDLANSTLFLVAKAANGESAVGTATLLSSFAVSAESDAEADQTPLLGSSVSLTVNATGALELDGIGSEAGYRLDVLITDTGDDTPIAALKVAEGSASGDGELIDISEMEVLNLNLVRGHKYQVSLTLAVFATAGAEGTAVANFGGSSASWEDLTIVAGTDLLGGLADLVDRVEDLENRVDDLEDAFLNHGHDYLTGRGNGHNNTTATTSGPEGGASIDPVEEDESAGGDDRPGNGPPSDRGRPSRHDR